MIESYIIAVLICISLTGRIPFHVFIEKKAHLPLNKTFAHMPILVIKLFIFFSWKVFFFCEFFFVVVVHLLSHIRLFATSWTLVCQASLSTIFQSLLQLMSVELVMWSSHLILCHPLLLLPSIFPSIRVFSSESTLNI